MFKTRALLSVALTVGVLGTSVVTEAKPKAPKTPAIQLSQAGTDLKADYAAELESLKQELTKSMPKLNDSKIAAFNDARDAEAKAKADLDAAKSALAKNSGHTGLLNHRKGWIGRATKGVAEAKAQLKQAEAMTGDPAAKAKALEEANKKLAEITKNYEMAASELKKSQALVDNAAKERPALEKAMVAAQEKLAAAQAKTLEAFKSLNIQPTLESDKLDAKLAKFVIIKEATPAGLAAFAQESDQHAKLLDQLFSDPALMTQMLIADGAAGGNYGRAMEIYTEIQFKSKNAKDGELQRLALATALEHATPLKLRPANADTSAPTEADPIARYMSYEKAYLAGELDANFANHSVWDYRHVIDGEEPDDIAFWGREMLKAYRPDQVKMKDDKWRYVSAVRTEIKYGSQNVKKDKDDLQFFQNILANGGVCGRRAFFGRFILRSFGVPTTARPSPGHAALVHKTPEGWVVVLGPGWGKGTTKGNYSADLDFLATTQAREAKDDFVKVKRAQWIGDVNGEKRVYGFLDKSSPEFWNAASLYEQRQILNDTKATALAAVGEELGEANETEAQKPVDEAKITTADRKVEVKNDGTILIPAVATTKPTKSTGKIIFSESYLGGMQLHYGRLGSDQPFEYTVEAPQDGTYQLTAKVVTPTPSQSLILSVNGGNATTIDLPYTVGLWETTKPIEITLSKGKNVLTFTREGDIRGVTMKHFELKPAGEKLAKQASAE